MSGTLGNVAPSQGTVVALSGSGVEYVDWLGNANSLSVTAPAAFEAENHDVDNPTADDTPNPLQGANYVDINHWPIPDPPDEAVVRDERDETRYQKAYSFTRRQPVRVRIFREE
jgi:hypothetical protein